MCVTKYYINGIRTFRIIYKLVKHIYIDILGKCYCESVDYRNHFRGKLNFPTRKELHI